MDLKVEWLHSFYLVFFFKKEKRTAFNQAGERGDIYFIIILLNTRLFIMVHLFFLFLGTIQTKKKTLRALFVFLALHYSADKTEGRSPPFCAEIIR